MPVATEPMFSSCHGRLSPAPLAVWEMEAVFRCPIVGMCLSLTEQKQLLRRAALYRDDLSLFEMHELLVAGAETDNPLSRKMDRLLRHKFEEAVLPLYMMEEKAFLHMWEEAFSSGNYAALVWAAATHAALSVSARTTIYEAVHMSMHGMAEEHQSLYKRLKKMEYHAVKKDEKYSILKNEYKQLKKEYRTLQAEYEALQAAPQPSHKQKQHCAAEVSLQDENAYLRTQLEEYQLLLEDEERSLKSLQARFDSVLCELETQKAFNEQLREEAQRSLHEFMNANQCDSSCPSFNLCKKRVLIVGGIERMESLYRSLIEKGGGTLEYHDGHVRGGVKKLEERLQRADIVLCPVNCNSHGACSMVKNLAKKHNKKVHMMSSFSLNAISNIIGKTCNE